MFTKLLPERCGGGCEIEHDVRGSPQLRCIFRKTVLDPPCYMGVLSTVSVNKIYL